MEVPVEERITGIALRCVLQLSIGEALVPRGHVLVDAMLQTLDLHGKQKRNSS